MTAEEATSIKPLTRPTNVQRALEYLLNIWGDYGRHEDNTRIVVRYIENLEKQILLLKDKVNRAESEE